MKMMVKISMDGIDQIKYFSQLPPISDGRRDEANDRTLTVLSHDKLDPLYRIVCFAVA